MLSYLRVVRVVQFTRPGRLLPWMGPALRGLIARPFKERVCLQPPAVREARWVHCRGCPHLAGCAYGQTLEPDPPPGTPVFRGREQAARPLVLTLPFPMPIRVGPGDRMPITLTLLGASAQRYEDEVWQSLADAGGRFGFDPARCTFTLEPGEKRDGPHPIELPAKPEGPEVEQVRVDLDSPLFLRTREEEGRRHHLNQPTFADLLRASLRTLGALFTLYDRPLQADFAALKAAAERVPTLRADFVTFSQEHQSNRSGRRTFYGTMGSGVYGPVPRALLRWLEWAGKVHVGQERVCGAGGWRVVVRQESARPAVSLPVVVKDVSAGFLSS
jgi:hypothetical protein